MSQRIQALNGDRVLEVTEMKPVKKRHSENQLRLRRERLLTAIDRFTAEIAEVDALLETIDHEKPVRE
jgi:hypothetical protein